MQTVLEMAKAHMVNVNKAINDLQNQKQDIEEQIVKLTQYLEECNRTILQHESNVSNIEAVE